jgi:hypothetical protein
MHRLYKCSGWVAATPCHPRGVKLGSAAPRQQEHFDGQPTFLFETTEIRYDVRKRRVALAHRHPAADHLASRDVLAVTYGSQ